MPETPLRFGLMTPIVTSLPRSHSDWEAEGGPDELREIALTADRLGYHHLTCSEHVGIPTEVAAVRGGRYYDPLATFGFIAALTQRVKLLTHVIVLPYHHPLAVAKRYGTLDRLSRGRVILGVGVGTLRPEFELVGAEFETRGERYEDALAALRAALGKRLPAYQGSFYQFDDFIIDPWAVQERMPIWLGGRTPRSLRRALVSGDGWDPFGLDLPQLTELLARARNWPEWQARTLPFEVALAAGGNFDITQPDPLAALIDQIAALRQAGATALNLTFRARSLAHYLEQIEIFAAQVAPRFM